MIQLFTIEHKRSDFIEMQYLSFKKHLKDNFDYIVFENASVVGDHCSYKQIKRMCEKYNITCISVQKDLDLILEFDNNEDSIRRKFHVFNGNGYTTASIANAYALEWVQKHFINKSTDHLCGLHSDVFMIKEDSLSQYLKNNDFLYISQGPEKAQYAWNALFLIKNTCPKKDKLKWWCGSINNIPVDVGGHSYYFLQHDDVIKNNIHFNHYWVDETCNFHPADYELISITKDSPVSFLHYRSGSNWNYRSEEYHKQKTIWLKNKIGLE